MTDDTDDKIPDDTEVAPEALLSEPGAAGDVPPAAGESATVSPEGAGPAPAAADAAVEEALPLVEALLFASSKPVPLEKLAEAAELPEATVAAAVAALETACAESGRGVRLDRVAGGVRLVTRPDYDYPVRRLLGLDGKTKLSMAALETLAIVAYRQPVTGPEIAELRSVNSSSSIRTLLDRKLITTAGRKEVVGTPFLYKTTKEFLVHFGLKGLGDLPKPEELEAIYGLEAPKPDPAQVELFHVDEATGEVEENAGFEAAGTDAATPPGDAPTAADVAGNDSTGPAQAGSGGAARGPEAAGPDEGTPSASTESEEKRDDG